MLLVLAALCVEAGLLGLAHWQWRRYHQRLDEHAAWLARPPVWVQGTYRPESLGALTHQPNPVKPEEMGWRVLGVLETAQGPVLIDRGFTAPRWLADNIPDFSQLHLPAGPQTLAALPQEIPTRKGVLRGPDTTIHPRLLAFLNPAHLTSGTVPTQAYVLTAPDAPTQPLNALPPPPKNPLRHLSYMVQWLMMAAIFPLLCVWAWHSKLTRPKR